MREKKRLQGKIVLITGGSRGIGKSIARRCSQAGAKVIIFARDEKELKKTREELEKESLFIDIRAIDLTDERRTKQCVAEVMKNYQQLDVLVNNLGGACRYGDFWEISEEDWRKSFDLNVMTMVRMTKLSIEHLKCSLCPRIINISSISGIEPGCYNPHYTAMKAATINFTKFLANFLVKDKISVNVVCPGPVVSDAWEQNIEQMAQKTQQDFEEVKKRFLETEVNKVPLGRLGTGEDIANMVLFLASEESSWITGSCFHINGGKMRSMS